MNRKIKIHRINALLLINFLIFVYLACISFASFAAEIDMPGDECVKNMKEIADYMDKEIKAAEPADLESLNIDEKLKACPASLKKYIIKQDGKDIIIICPSPLEHGCVYLKYSSSGGISRKPVSFDYIKKQKLEDVGPLERKEILDFIKAFYDSYKEKDLDKILSFQAIAIQSTALNYKDQNKFDSKEVWMAYKTINEDLIQHQDYSLLPLDLYKIYMKKFGNIYLINSPKPIIASNKVKIIEENKKITFSLKISKLLILREGKLLHIIQIDF